MPIDFPIEPLVARSHRRVPPAPVRALLMLCLAALACGAGAQTHPYPLIGVVELTPQSFQIHHGNFESTQDRGMVGGGGGYLAEETEAPRYEIPGDGTLRLDLRLSRKVLYRNDPHGLAIVGWSIDLESSDIIKDVRIVFDTGTVSSNDPGQSASLFKIPKGARHVLRIETDYEWLENTHTCIWKATAGSAGPSGLLVAGAPLLYYFLRKKKHFVTIRLVDEEGKEVTGEPYEITLPTGETRRGKTDAGGQAREAFEIGDADIPVDSTVTFPDRAASSWGPVD